jgi:uncharacterized protein YecT (DUF1311 family)
MRYRPVVLTLALCAMAPLPGHAADLSQEYGKCIAANDTNTGLIECSMQEIDRQEKRLAEAWTAVSAAMQQVSPESFSLLLKGEIAWGQYKDSACDFYTRQADFGREGTVLRFGACKATIIADRIQDLAAISEFLKHRRTEKTPGE